MSQTHKRPQPKPPPSPVPFLLILGGVVLIGLTAFLLLREPATPKAAVEVKGAPALRADQTEINLGDVPLGQTVEASFQISNVGDQPLRFSEEPYIEVKEGC